MNSLPAELIRSLRNLESFNEEAFISVHQQGGQITSVRMNPNKSWIPDPGSGIRDPVPWCSNGFYLTERPSFTLDPLFHAGAYYVQEASSMFLEEVLKQTVDLTRPVKVLDLCAAPGGKSTLIQSVISKDSLLVSNEVIRARVNILSENMTKWGAANVIVTNNDPRDFQRLENYFDVIVVDAPCSGSGLFRKDPDAISEWSENNVQLCAQRQQRILADVMPALKEEGILIYSTCSYSQDEDEEIADWLVEEFAADSLQLTVRENQGIVETVSSKYNSFGYRFYPDKVKGEGFFIAAFKKNPGKESVNQVKSHPSAPPRTKAKRPVDGVTAREKEIVKRSLNDADDLVFIKQQEEVLAIPLTMEDDLAFMRSALYIKKAGIKIGAIIREELVPAHELAVSTLIGPSVARFEVDKETALQYLRRDEIKIETEYKGWALLTFRALPIGWVKVLANRINNYYPAAWRILNR